MQQFIDIALEIFYIIMGLLMLVIAYKSWKTIDSGKRYVTALFWLMMSVVFIFGKLLPYNVTGGILVLTGLLTVSKRVVFARYDTAGEAEAQEASERIKGKIFIPSLVLAFAAVLVAMGLVDYKNSSQFAIGVGAIAAMATAFFITKAKPKQTVNDGARLLHQMGPTSMLPQLLVALGVLFTKAGVGEVISKYISMVVPQDNRLLGVVAYVFGMALFTMVMGNAFAAFSVITAGIGVPFVLTQGADPVIVGAFALTAGYCGTLLTPMAANFNIVPSALLDCKDQNGVIKAQAPVAAVLLAIHIFAMYFLAF